MEFARANSLVIGNTRFIKRESHLITYCSGEHKTQVDYVLYRKSYRRAVRDVKVIPLEECVRQHNLVDFDIAVHIPAVKKRKFTPRIRTWKLRDPAVASRFQKVFQDKVITATNTSLDCPVEDAWSRLKDPILETAKEVCGLSKKHQWKPETWWWDERVEDAIAEKQALYKTYKALAKPSQACCLACQI